jgi:Contact-dependent growth inhibition CdiA C-terminal domain
MAGPDPITPSSGYGPVPGSPAFNPALWQQAMQEAGIGRHDAGGDSAAKPPSDSPLAGFLAPSASPTALGGVLAWAAQNAPGLARAAAGGVAGAVLLTPLNTQRQTTEVSVAGHPELGARWDRAPGSIGGMVTLYARGPDGQQAGPGLRLDMDAQGRLTGQRGTAFDGLAFGALPLDGGGVRLAPGLEAALAGGTGPQAGSDPAGPPAQTQPEQQVGVGYEARTPEEAERAAEMHAQGKNGNDIAAELDRMRGNTGVATTDQRTPGKLTGSLDSLEASEKDFVRELLAQGHDVEVIPTGKNRTPDFKVDGTLTELKTLSGVTKQTPDGLSSALSSRIMDARGQATTVIVDARKQPGMTQEIAQRGISRALGVDRLTGDKMKNITVLASDGIASFRR